MSGELKATHTNADALSLARLTVLHGEGLNHEANVQRVANLIAHLLKGEDQYQGAELLFREAIEGCRRAIFPGHYEENPDDRPDQGV